MTTIADLAKKNRIKESADGTPVEEPERPEIPVDEVELRRAEYRERKARQRAREKEAGKPYEVSIDHDLYEGVKIMAELRLGTTVKDTVQRCIRLGFTQWFRDRPRRPRFLSFFSGVEAFSAAVEPLGWTCAGVAQWDPKDRKQFAATVLAKRLGFQVGNLGDVTGVEPEDLAGFDVLVGGSPCQAFSVAGQQRGLDDPRGQLTVRFIDLARNAAIAPSSKGVKGTPIILWENVVGVLSIRYDKADLDRRAKEIGKDAAIKELDAAYNDDEDVFGSVLATLAGSGKDGAIPRPRGKNGKVESWPRAGVVVGPERTVAWRVLNAFKFGIPQGRKRVFMIATRHGDGLDPVKMLFDRPVVHDAAVHAPGGSVFRPIENKDQGPLLPIDADLQAALVRDPELEEPYILGPTEATYMLKRAEVFEGKTEGAVLSHLTPLIKAMLTKAAAGQARFQVSELGAIAKDLPKQRGGTAIFVHHHAASGRTEVQTDKANTLLAMAGDGRERRAFIIRRQGDLCWVRTLMPIEAERLMGFPEGWTDIAVADPQGNPVNTEGPRIRAMGNSMAVPVMKWLAERIEQELALAVYRCDHLPETGGAVAVRQRSKKESALRMRLTLWGDPWKRITGEWEEAVIERLKSR